MTLCMCQCSLYHLAFCLITDFELFLCFRIITIQSSPDDELHDKNSTLTTDTAIDTGVNLYMLAGHEAMQLWFIQPVHHHNHHQLNYNQYFGAIISPNQALKRLYFEDWHYTVPSS